MPSSEDFPLRIDAVTAAWASERRPEEDFSGAQSHIPVSEGLSQVHFP